MSSLAKRLFRCLPYVRSTRTYKFILNRLRLPTTARLLDLGSGQGYGSAFSKSQVFGMDISFECQQGAQGSNSYPGGYTVPHRLRCGVSLALGL